jgi:hypothetical protein
MINIKKKASLENAMPFLVASFGSATLFLYLEAELPRHSAFRTLHSAFFRVFNLFPQPVNSKKVRYCHQSVAYIGEFPYYFRWIDTAYKNKQNIKSLV